MAMNKRQKAILAAVVPGKAYAFDEAVKIIKNATNAKFVESVDVAVRLGVDAKKSDQQVRGSTVLLKKAAGITSGSKRPNTEKVGKVTRAQLEAIAKQKEADLTAADLDAAVKTIAGSARSMGLVVEG